METMVWNDWTNENEVPLNTWLLMKIEGSYPFQTGIFRKTANNSRIGTVGNYFHFDQKIIKWMVLSPEILDV